MFRLIVRFSKYDFWNPGQISDFKNIFSKNIFYFSKSKKISKKIRNLEKVGYSRNFKDFQWVSLVIGLEGENKNFALATGEGGVGS